jgi:hypothetical protein
MKDVSLRKTNKKQQTQSQAAKRGRLGRRAGKMSGDDLRNIKKIEDRHQM